MPLSTFLLINTHEIYTKTSLVHRFVVLTKILHKNHLTPGTSPVDRHSLNTVNRRHSPSVARYLTPDIDRFFSLTSIDIEPRDMFATLSLVHDERGDLHDQEGHLRNTTG